MGKRRRRIEKKRVFKEKHKVLVSGEFSSSASGFGFVTGEDGAETFIPPGDVNGALDGDTVTVEITYAKDPRGPVGKIVSIDARKRDFVVGAVLDPHTIRPLNKNLPQEIKISGGVLGAKRGDWVRARLLDNGKKHTEKLKGAVEERLDRSGSVYGDMLAVAKEFSMPDPYSPEAEKEALKITPVNVDRTDLTALRPVTIDPVDAKDFDDAVSIEEKDGEWLVGVHISDVAAYIRPGAKFDKTARQRAFSSYIPGMFRPMLPKPLTAKISLREGERSCAHTVILRVRKRDGKVIGHTRVHSTIIVKKRLDFDAVQAFAETGDAPKTWDRTVSADIAMLLKAVKKMRAYRKKGEEFLEIETAETRVLCDETTHEITGIETRLQREADKLVEECMLAANTAVAEEMCEKGIPGIYRIHPEPDPERLDEFSLFALSILKKNTGDLSSRKVVNEFLANLPDDHRKPVLTSAFLRAMARASYAAEPGLHYGLGKGRYSHFTSPIRRYSDLTTHQQLMAYDMNTRMRSKKTLSEVALEISKKEERNDEAYFAASDRLKLHYLRKLGEEEKTPRLFEGVVAKVTGGGLLCDIAEFGLRGFVPSRFLYTRKSRPKAGDFLFLYIDSLDFTRGSAVFRPVV